MVWSESSRPVDAILASRDRQGEDFPAYRLHARGSCGTELSNNVAEVLAVCLP